MKKKFVTRRIPALFLALSLLCTSCGSQARATTMSLARTQGTVEIHSEDGKEIEPLDNIKLYSGYDLETMRKSYAWFNLDNVKLAKLDVKSEAVVLQDGGALEIELVSGSLFFNITEPLGEEESLTIRSSNMAVGIRGTCGWVELTDEQHMIVYILEGTVECGVTDESGGVSVVSVSAGEKAELSPAEDAKGADGDENEDALGGNENDKSKSEGSLDESGNPRGNITVSSFPVTEVPDFVTEELVQDEALASEILEASGLDVLNPPALAALDALAGLPYYGDLSQCAMTVEQAAAYAAILEENIRESETAVWDEWYAYNYPKPKFCWAALFDAGDGIPALWVVGGYDMEYPTDTLSGLNYGYDERSAHYPYMSRIYQWDGSRAVLAMDILPDNGYSTITGQGLVLIYQTDFNFNAVSPEGELYPISEGLISEEPAHVIESILIEQEDMPSLEELQAFVAAKGEPDRIYDYGSFSSDLWQDWGWDTPEWHLYALDGVIMSGDAAGADINAAWESLTGFSLERSIWVSDLGEFGFGPLGAQDYYCHWLGDWKDGSEVAEILRNAAQ